MSVDQIRNDLMNRIPDERRVDFEEAMHGLIARAFHPPTRDVRILAASGLGPHPTQSFQRSLPTRGPIAALGLPARSRRKTYLSRRTPRRARRAALPACTQRHYAAWITRADSKIAFLRM